MIVEPQLKGPIDVEIIRLKSGGERVLLGDFDASMIMTKYEIHASPGRLKDLVVTIPIGRLTVRDERIDVTAIGGENQYI